MKELTKSKNGIEQVASGNKKTTLVSLQIAELITKSSKCHSMAEVLLRLAAQIMCETD